jgi:hypothetical protein
MAGYHGDAITTLVLVADRKGNQTASISFDEVFPSLLDLFGP